MKAKNIIELKEEQVVRVPLLRRLLRWIVIQAFKLGLFCVLAVYTAHYLSLGYAWGLQQYQESKAAVLDRLTIIKAVDKPSSTTDIDAVLHSVAREYEIDPMILEVIRDKESAGGRLLYRFEPGKYAERERADRRLGLSDDERRMENSSHGIFHVMGYTARTVCGIHWSALYDPWECTRCAATIVSRNLEATKGIKQAGPRLREVFRMYNGSGESAEQYADDAMSRVAQRLYHGMMSSNGA